MTIDEAIKHCLEVAEHNEYLHKRGYAGGCNSHDCLESAIIHRQLAEWLMELKEFRADDWKKVEQELPKEWYQVLVYRAIGIIEMAMYTGKLWLSITQKPIKDVAYWKYTKEPKGERLDDMLELIGGEDNDD